MAASRLRWQQVIYKPHIVIITGVWQYLPVRLRGDLTTPLNKSLRDLNKAAKMACVSANLKTIHKLDSKSEQS